MVQVWDVVTNYAETTGVTCSCLMHVGCVITASIKESVHQSREGPGAREAHHF